MSAQRILLEHVEGGSWKGEAETSGFSATSIVIDDPTFAGAMSKAAAFLGEETPPAIETAAPAPAPAPPEVTADMVERGFKFLQDADIDLGPLGRSVADALVACVVGLDHMSPEDIAIENLRRKAAASAPNQTQPGPTPEGTTFS